MFDGLVNLVTEWGYAGVVGLMILENLFPPIPSELIMSLAGFVAAQGGMSLPLVILAGTVGSVIGLTPWYVVGRVIGEPLSRRLVERFGRFMTMSPGEFDRAVLWFARSGWSAVLFGRMVPAARTLISVPAGVARMPFLPFIAFSTIGSLIWVGLISCAGYVLESQYERVKGVMDEVTIAVIGLAVAVYLIRLFRQETRARAS
jgi:membrane protein DedA with SNARE-associated domain